MEAAASAIGEKVAAAAAGAAAAAAGSARKTAKKTAEKNKKKKNKKKSRKGKEAVEDEESEGQMEGGPNADGPASAEARRRQEAGRYREPGGGGACGSCPAQWTILVTTGWCIRGRCTHHYTHLGTDRKHRPTCLSLATRACMQSTPV